MWKRFWRRLRTQLPEQWRASLEDSDELLARAQREMQEMHVKNRERAVQAITQKNNLQIMVRDTEQRIARMEAEAEAAERSGDREQALMLHRHIVQYETTLTATKASLAQAIEVSETIKTAIRREEERIRQKTAEALALKAQWKVAQIQNALLSRQLQEIVDPDFRLPLRTVRTRHAHNRALCQEIIQQKNALAEMADDTQKRVDNLQAKADAARGRGDDELLWVLLREAEQFEASLAVTEAARDQAVEVAERAQEALRREEAWVRERAEMARAAGESVEDEGHGEGEACPSTPFGRLQWIFAGLAVVVAAVLAVVAAIAAGLRVVRG